MTKKHNQPSVGGREKIKQTANRIIRENHCRYCGRLQEDGIMGDKCRSDIEYATDEIVEILDQAIAQREEELVDKVLSIIPDEVCTGRLGGLEAYTKEDEAVNAFISKIKQDLQSIKEDK